MWFVKHVVYFLIFEDCFVPLSSSLDLFQLEAVLIEPVHLHCTGDTNTTRITLNWRLVRVGEAPWTAAAHNGG